MPSALKPRAACPSETPCKPVSGEILHADLERPHPPRYWGIGYEIARQCGQEPGSPDPFPPTVADPGAVADAEWSSIVVLPSGIVINAQIVDNKTGTHDRLKSVDIKHRTVTLSILDGTQGGQSC
jgi:hypothetical protein